MNYFINIAFHHYLTPHKWYANKCNHINVPTEYKQNKINQLPFFIFLNAIFFYYYYSKQNTCE